MSHSCSSSVQHQVKKYSFLGLFFFCFFNLPPWQMSEVNWRDKSKLVTGCKRAHGQQTPAGMGEGMSASGRRSPAPRVKLLSCVQAGGVWDQHLLPVGSLVLQSCSGPAFHPFASLGWRADGWEVNLMRNVTVRYFVKKTTPTPPNISSFLCSSLDPFSLNCSSLAGTGPPCRDKWFTDSCDLYLICKFRL